MTSQRSRGTGSPNPQDRTPNLHHNRTQWRRQACRPPTRRPWPASGLCMRNGTRPTARFGTQPPTSLDSVPGPAPGLAWRPWMDGALARPHISPRLSFMAPSTTWLHFGSVARRVRGTVLTRDFERRGRRGDQRRDGVRAEPCDCPASLRGEPGGLPLRPPVPRRMAGQRPRYLSESSMALLNRPPQSDEEEARPEASRTAE